MGHGLWETPEVLRGEVVPVIWGTFVDRCCNPNISNPHYVMSSRHDREEINTDECALRQSSDRLSTTPASNADIEVMDMFAIEVCFRCCLEGSNTPRPIWKGDRKSVQLGSKEWLREHERAKENGESRSGRGEQAQKSNKGVSG